MPCTENNSGKDSAFGMFCLNQALFRPLSRFYFISIQKNISNLTLVFILEPGKKIFLKGVGHEIITDLHMKKRTRATMQSRMIMTAIPMKTVEALHKKEIKDNSCSRAVKLYVL
jgi:hypothetical protein